MEIGTPAIAAFAVYVSIITLLHARSFLDHLGAAATAPAPPTPINSALSDSDLLLFAATEGLTITVAFIYHHMHRVARGNRRISELLTFVLCTLVSLLLLFLFFKPAGGADNDAQAQVLGLVAVRALPAAATAAFYSGIILIYAHVDGGGLAPVPAVRLLAKITLGAAAAVVSLRAVAALYD